MCKPQGCQRPVKDRLKELRVLTPEEFERAAARLRNPPPASRIEAAREFGIDLTLLIENLRRSPAERAAKLRYCDRRSFAARPAGESDETSRRRADSLAEVPGLGSFDEVKRRSLEVDAFERRVLSLSIDALIEAKRSGHERKT